MKSKSKKKLKKINFKDWIKKEEVKIRFKWFALFFLGFLIGIMFKSQASRTIVAGYDDYRAMQNLSGKSLGINEENIEN